MTRKSLLAAASAGFAALVLCASAQAFDLNENIDIAPGSESGGKSTVNGSITVGSEAVVNGDLETVNGSIRIDEGARVGDAQTVNGKIRLASGVTAGGIQSVNGAVTVERDSTLDDIDVVNGEIRIEAGVRVASDVANVNGEIRIAGAEIGGDLDTVNGDVTLSGTRVAGDFTVHEPEGFNFGSDEPKIVIGPGVRVDGAIVLEREVELYVSDDATIGEVRGVMSLDDAERFSGDHP
jgi:hypothetical protein